MFLFLLGAGLLVASSENLESKWVHKIVIISSSGSKPLENTVLHGAPWRDYFLIGVCKMLPLAYVTFGLCQKFGKKRNNRKKRKNRKHRKKQKIDEFGGFGPGNGFLRRFGVPPKKSSTHMPWRRLFGPNQNSQVFKFWPPLKKQTTIPLASSVDLRAPLPRPTGESPRKSRHGPSASAPDSGACEKNAPSGKSTPRRPLRSRALHSTSFFARSPNLRSKVTQNYKKKVQIFKFSKNSRKWKFPKCLNLPNF